MCARNTHVEGLFSSSSSSATATRGKRKEAFKSRSQKKTDRNNVRTPYYTCRQTYRVCRVRSHSSTLGRVTFSLDSRDDLDMMLTLTNPPVAFSTSRPSWLAPSHGFTSKSPPICLLLNIVLLNFYRRVILYETASRPPIKTPRPNGPLVLDKFHEPKLQVPRQRNDEANPKGGKKKSLPLFFAPSLILTHCCQ